MIVIVTAAVRGSIPLLFLGFFLFGGATAAGFQARYAAVDLAPAALRGRHLSLIVWATTLGAVVGPSLAPLAGASVGRYGVPTLAGPFVFFSALLFGLAALLLILLMRPGPGGGGPRRDPDPSLPKANRPLLDPGCGQRTAVRAVAPVGSPGRERDGGREPGHDRRMSG